MAEPVTLQISLCPLDLAHAALIVPHQLKIWAPQCAETLLVWDLDPGPRYQDSAFRQKWDAGLTAIQGFCQALLAEWPQLKFAAFQAQPELLSALASRFFVPGTPLLPAKDFRGRPIAAYFYALAIAANDWVLHLDGDMMFGGQSSRWVAEARAALQADASLLYAMPSVGPVTSHPLRGPEFTARCFFLDRRRLARALTPELRQMPDLFEARWVPPYAETAELMIAHWMARQGLQHLALLGTEPGMWWLHPPVPASPAFLPALPQLLQALAADALPALQNGSYDLLEATLEALNQSQDSPDPDSNRSPC